MGFEHGLDATTLQDGRLSAARVFRTRGRQQMAPHLSRRGTRIDRAHHHRGADQPSARDHLPHAAWKRTAPSKTRTALGTAPVPAAGPYYAELGDGTTVTYHWYRFVDQPAIVHANLPDSVRDEMQARVELIHANWSDGRRIHGASDRGQPRHRRPRRHRDAPRRRMEVGYVPIVTRQESTPEKLRVFILAGPVQHAGLRQDLRRLERRRGQHSWPASRRACAEAGATSCDFTLDMFDGYGDGWNGWVYDFVQNGEVVASETLAER